MLRKMVSLLTVLCVISLSSVGAFAMETGQDLSSYSKEWHLDVMACVVEKGDGTPSYLPEYTPKSASPFISFSTPYDVEQIWTYDCGFPKGTAKKQCPICNSEMKYADVLYEINENCGHGVFCFTYYCKKDGVFVPDRFYTQCGCE